MTKELGELLKFFKELFAILHWLSNVAGFITLVSERGITEGLVLWIISSVISAIFAELVETRIPSALRPLFKYLFED